MIGATVVTVLAMGAAAAILPAVVGTITMVIALGRRDRRDAGTSLRSLTLAASHIPRRVI